MKAGDYQFEWPLVGNDHVIEYLTKSIANKAIAGVYIFCGPAHLGKTTTAYRFAQIVLCEGAPDRKDKMPCGKCHSCLKFNKRDGRPGGGEPAGEEAETIIHSDFYVLTKEKDKKNISIEQSREFIRKLGMSSFLNSYKIGVIKDAHLLSIEAANALLKTLEEPKNKVSVILITPDIHSLPTTIVSRSQIIKFNPVKADLIYDYLLKNFKAPRSAAKNFSRLCLGRPALAAKFFEDKDYLSAYLKKAEIFFGLISGSGNKFEKIEELLGGKRAGQDAVRAAEETLAVWQGAARDIILLNYGLDDLARNHILEEELEKVKNKFSARNLLDLSEFLRQAEIYLRANVNPKTVLEQIAINV